VAEDVEALLAAERRQGDRARWRCSSFSSSQPGSNSSTGSPGRGFGTRSTMAAATQGSTKNAADGVA